MTRLLSGAVLVAMAVSAIWFLGTLPLLAVAELVLLLALHEYDRVAGALDLQIAGVVAGAAAMLTCAAVALPGAPLGAVLVAALVALGALALVANRPAARSLGDVVALHRLAGREGLLLLMATVMASDTCQYYTGRAFGRRPLAPAISPGKTVEGALGGFVGGAACFAIVGHWWLPAVPVAMRVLLGLALVALGIVGDLFESRLKRGAGLKDSSTLIPGHGGVLDRIDALLFAAPVFYVFVRYGFRH